MNDSFYSQESQQDQGNRTSSRRKAERPRAEPVAGSKSLDEGVQVGGLAVGQYPARSTIRPGANRQGGEDTVDFGLLVTWNPASFEKLATRLEIAQKAAQNNDLEGSLVHLTDDIQALVWPSGKRAGLYYKYVIETQGMRFDFMANEKPNKETPNVNIHIGAIPLLVLGLKEAHQRAVKLIQDMGGYIIGEKLSRVDPCVDMVGVDVSSFVQAFLDRRCVRRPRKATYHEDNYRWTGVSLGNGSPLSLRIYDKVLECKGSPKWEYMMIHRFEGEDVEVCTRVEFQLRRKPLKEFGIENVNDWLQKRASIVKYLVTEWFRITDQPVDRANSQRFGPSQLWQDVIAGFETWTGNTDEIAKREAKPRFDADELKAQAIGCFISAAAVCGTSIKSVRDLVHFVVTTLADKANSGKSSDIINKYIYKYCLIHQIHCT